MKIDKLKPHIPYILILLVFTLIFFYNYFNPSLPLHDGATYYFPLAETLKTSFKDYGDFWPLWTPYGFSGSPFLMKHLLGLDGVLGIMLFIIPNTIIALKSSYVVLFFISAASMYALMIYLKVGKRFALVSALIYVLNGHVMSKLLRWWWLTTLGGYAIIPLIFLFGMKSIKEKEWIRNSIITGVLLAIQLRMDPDMRVGLWVGSVFGLYLIISLIGRNFSKKAVKISLVSIIILLVFFGLSAQRILPHKESLSISSRAQISWETASSRQVPLKDIPSKIIEPGIPKITDPYGSGDHIGIVALLLVLFAVYKKHNNKNVLFFFAIMILSVLLATNSFNLYFYIWHLPFFKSLRYLDRVLFLFVFSASVLAGIGASEFFEKIKRQKLVYFALIGLILINLWAFNYSHYTTELSKWHDPYEAIKNNQILQFISSQKGTFRIQTWETRGIDWGTEMYNIPLKLEHIYRYDTAWYPPYMNVYLSIALNDPAKFWGILNLKYLTARDELNVSGFKFVKKFENCTVCYPEYDQLAKAWGPYLYENEQFLPRAYILNESVLVVGEDDAVTQTIYALMLNENFNPSNLVIIRGKESINDYSFEELKRFKAIFLTKGSVDQNSQFILGSYANSGGIILPDITKGKNSISEDDINILLNSFKDKFTKIEDKDVIMHNFDKREIILNDQKGFLVYSEKFSVFDGWKASSNKKQLEIYNADAMISSIYLDGTQKNVIFEYKPKSYTTGLNITVITLLILLFYGIYSIYKKHKEKNLNTSSNNPHSE
ncbi:MAG: hypothetical protein KKC75_02500 [Nanoarchaeota archaeon]|nr:hypothetical protein [Nanoarchaeota archaeon]